MYISVNRVHPAGSFYAYNPLAGGILTGKHKPDADPDAGRCVRPYPESSRAYSCPWSPCPPRRARPGPCPHIHDPLRDVPVCACEDRVLDGPASGTKGSKIRKWLEAGPSRTQSQCGMLLSVGCRLYLTERVYEAVLQKSIPTEMCQPILYIVIVKDKSTNLCGN